MRTTHYALLTEQHAHLIGDHANKGLDIQLRRAALLARGVGTLQASASATATLC